MQEEHEFSDAGQRKDNRRAICPFAAFATSVRCMYMRTAVIMLSRRLARNGVQIDDSKAKRGNNSSAKSWNGSGLALNTSSAVPRRPAIAAGLASLVVSAAW